MLIDGHQKIGNHIRILIMKMIIIIEMEKIVKISFSSPTCKKKKDFCFVFFLHPLNY